MDEFAALRRRLYDAYGPPGTAASGPATRELYAALLGEAVDRDPLCAQVLAARLAADGAGTEGAGADQALLQWIGHLGKDPYIDRYLADALQRALPRLDRAEVAARLAEAGRRAMDRALRPGGEEARRAAAVMTAAAELELPVFASEQVLPLLDCGDADLRAASAHYAASLHMVQAVEPLLAAAERAAAARRADTGLDDRAEPGDRALEAAASAVAAALECGGDCAETALQAERRLARPGLAAQLLYSDMDPKPWVGALAQTMFYGDPARPGRGASGGIATLVRVLGDALAAGGRPVLTVVPYNTASASYPFRAVEPLGPGHVVLRLPLHLPSEDALGFLRSHGRIRAGLRRMFRLAGVRPAVLHVRFLDNASLAAAREAASLGAALVTTLTPDPHRSLCDASGRLQRLGPGESMEALDKIAAGDELLRRSRGIAAIGERSVREQLLPYFPQLESARGQVVAGIDEGIRLQPPGTGIDAPGMFADPSLELGLAEPPRSRPVILNVGRLSPLKGQLNLLRAWLQVGGWRRHELVLVGGDFRNPAPGEREIIQEIRRLVAGSPECRGHVAHLEALPNEQVRQVEAFLGARALSPLPDLYVCSSYKEEFGLSILEAMAAGMVACAPLRGGARRYLRHGVNGFLVDTSGPQALARDLEAVLEGLSTDRVRALQANARDTVRRGYSIERMAERFDSLYRQVTAGS